MPLCVNENSHSRSYDDEVRVCHFWFSELLTRHFYLRLPGTFSFAVNDGPMELVFEDIPVTSPIMPVVSMGGDGSSMPRAGRVAAPPKCEGEAKARVLLGK